MTQISRIIVMTGLFVMPATLALSQEAPAPPTQSSPWRTPRPARPVAIAPFDDFDVPMPPMPPMAPMPAMPAMLVMPAMPVMPPMPAMAPMAPMGPMALLAPMPPLPAELADFGFLAFQDAAPRAARVYVGSDAARARSEARRAQDNDERYYRSGKSYLDRKEYDKAVDAFNRVIENKGSRSDGSLYWRAYAQNRLGKREDALASLAELQKSYPSSHWLDDANALQQ